MFKYLILSTFLVFSVCSIQAQGRLNPVDSIIFKKIIKEFSRRDALETGYVFNRVTRKWDKAKAAISPATFDSIYKPIFGKVMLGNSDLVNQGSAYALSVDQFESQFSLNYNWAKDKKNIKGFYWNAGFAASSSSKILPIFSKDSWQQGFTLTFGITGSLKKVLSYTREPEYDIKKNRALALSLKETYQVLLVDTMDIVNKIGEVNPDKIKWSDDSALYETMIKLQLKDNKELESEEAKLIKGRYIRSFDIAHKKLELYVDSCISSFELSYFKDVNYSFFWYNVLLRPEYKGLSIYDTTGARISDIQKKDYFRLGLDANINFVRNEKKFLLLTQAGFGIKNTNYLEGRKPGDIEFLKSSVSDTTAITKTSEGIIVDNYDKYKKLMILITPVIGFNFFVGEKRYIGFETFASAKLGLKRDNIPFDNLFTIRSGFLFSLNGKSDLTKSTFGILTQWEDVKFKSASIKDNFTLNLRIGIPFNL